MRKFIVDENFWKIFPTAKIAVLTVKNVKEFVQLDEKSAT